MGSKIDIMEKIAFIINPFSAKKEYQTFLDKLKKNIPHPNYIVSQSIEHTHQFMEQQWESVDIFVAVGGDGTISTIAQKLINTDKILGIYPAGSGNGFANETGFTKNISTLLSKLQQKTYEQIDTFLVNDKLSINVSGVGFDGEVAKRFEKTNRGFKNYIKTSIHTFFDFNPITIQFGDEHKKYNGKYMMINIANTRQFGNHAYIAPNAKTTDGMVDMVLVKKFSAWYSLFFAIKMFSKTLKTGKYIDYLRLSNIEFEIDTNTWHVDGEYTAVSSPIKIKVLPKSLKILK